MERKQVVLSWADCQSRRNLLMQMHGIGPTTPVYGIPRGGQYVAAMFPFPVEIPEEAEFLVDDIIDSGATAKAWSEKYDRPVIALVNKRMSTGPDRNLPWVVFPWEMSLPLNSHGIRDHIIRGLEWIGEDPMRPGLQDTPARVERALDELLGGYRIDPVHELGKVFPDIQSDEVIVLRDIRFTSFCEHHLLPFSGLAHVGYLPDGCVVGLSKLARVVDAFSRRLQVQERLTTQIAMCIFESLKAKGAGVVIEAKHQCMGCRGVKQPDATMVTSSLQGCFRTSPDTRSEFFRLARIGER